MDDLKGIIIGSLISIISAGTVLIVAWFKMWTKRINKLEAEKNEYKQSKEQKELRIEHLQNGFRDEVNDRLKGLEGDMIIIKKVICKNEKDTQLI